MATELIMYCYYLLEDGTAVCARCDEPPERYKKRLPAPKGARPGDEVSPEIFDVTE